MKTKSIIKLLAGVAILISGTQPSYPQENNETVSDVTFSHSQVFDDTGQVLVDIESILFLNEPTGTYGEDPYHVQDEDNPDESTIHFRNSYSYDNSLWFYIITDDWGTVLISTEDLPFFVDEFGNRVKHRIEVYEGPFEFGEEGDGGPIDNVDTLRQNHSLGGSSIKRIDRDRVMFPCWPNVDNYVGEYLIAILPDSDWEYNSENVVFKDSLPQNIKMCEADVDMEEIAAFTSPTFVEEITGHVDGTFYVVGKWDEEINTIKSPKMARWVPTDVFHDDWDSPFGEALYIFTYGEWFAIAAESDPGQMSYYNGAQMDLYGVTSDNSTGNITVHGSGGNYIFEMGRMIYTSSGIATWIPDYYDGWQWVSGFGYGW